MDYFDKCLDDLDSLDAELIEVADNLLTKKAMLIHQMERVAIKRMNEIVDSAFEHDIQLREQLYAFDTEHDHDTNRWVMFFDSDSVSYGEDESVFYWRSSVGQNLSKLHDYQLKAFAVQGYLIENYIAPDPICSKYYDTARITNPHFANLHPGYWYVLNTLHSSDIKKSLRTKVKEQREKRIDRLISWVARVNFERQYAPGTKTFEKIASRFERNLSSSNFNKII